jgi:hypothetical protein
MEDLHGKVEETDIPNAELAQHHLRQMGMRAEDMQAKVKGIVERITHLESAKPWGHTAEYSGPFEAEYLAGQDKGGGAHFVRDKVKILGEETLHGLAMADWAIKNSVNLDASSADMYRVDGTDQVGTGMVNTENGLADNAKQQQQQAESQE